MSAALGCTLPDGRSLALAPEVASRLCCGIVVMQGVAVTSSEGPGAETARLAEELRARYAGLLPSEIPVLAPARNLYKSFGMDPSRHRPSSEALLRRVLKGEALYRINSAVDACNLASLSFVLPIGMYDLGKVQGGIVLRTGAPGESYPGIRKGQVNLAGRLGLFDQVGPFGSPTSDSERTCVEDQTVDLLAAIMADREYSRSAMAAHGAEFGRIFGEHCGASMLLGTVLGGEVKE